MKRNLLISAALLITVSLVAFAQFRPPGNFKNEVTIKEAGQNRVITANGIPDHKPGQFPNLGNPNFIRPQRYQLRMPLKPKANRQATPVGMQLFGIALNGVPFDPGANEFWRRDRRSGWQYEALSENVNLGLDRHHAHVQPNGAYHYHGLPTGLVKSTSNSKAMQLIGYAADGFPVYSSYGYSDPENASSELKLMKSSYQLKKGTRPSGPKGRYDGTFVQDYEYVAESGDLDECNGRVGITPEYPDGIYHYYITEQFPFIPRYFRGTPDRSFMTKGPPGRRPPGRPPRRGF